jgi:hypothetical protein
VIQPLSCFSEQYTAHGNVAAEGILNQLGRPGLDLLSILVRETVQNSWDARCPDETTVRFTVEERRLAEVQLGFLRHWVLKDVPEYLKLHDALSTRDVDGMHVLVISDRGTVGLNGPIRANAEDDDTASRNFANFFFNVGQSKGHQSSGGTYGYGKSILYRASQIHTICVYTRCLAQGRLESRFMAAAIQPQEEKGSGYRRHTGRHWWGYLKRRESIIEPATGFAADELAMRLGLPLFQGDETGTSCMVLLPTLGDGSPHEAMQRISQILLWHCWPKMVGGVEGKSPMQFAVYCDGQPVPLPDPSNYPPLSGFVDAMRLLKTSQPSTNDPFSKVVSIDSLRPKRHLGQLALARFMEQERKDIAAGSKSEFTPPIPGISHHVALLRGPELVVKYLEGEHLPISRLEYAGVFLADPDVDASFAKAEPPTHDDWNTKSMTEKEDKSVVTVALRRIHEELKDLVTPQATGKRDEEMLPLGDFADLLGSMLIGVEGTAAYVEPVEEYMWNKPAPRRANDSHRSNTTGSFLFASHSEQMIGENRDGGQYTTSVVTGNSQNYNTSSDNIITPGSSDRNGNGQYTTEIKNVSTDHNNVGSDAISTTGKDSNDPSTTPITPSSNANNNASTITPGSSSEKSRDGQTSTSIPTASANHNEHRDNAINTASHSPEKVISGKSWNQETANSEQERILSGIRGKAKIELVGEEELTLVRGTPVVLTGFRVKHALHAKFTRVEVEVGILLDNGEEENAPPANKALPDVLLWIDSTGKERSGSDAILIPATDEGIWKVAVSLPDDALLRVNLLTREVF